MKIKSIEERMRDLDNDRDGGCSVVYAARLAREYAKERTKPLWELLNRMLDAGVWPEYYQEIENALLEELKQQ